MRLSEIRMEPNATTKALNPHLFRPVVMPEAKRLRQDSKPLLNKLEAAWLAVLKVEYPGIQIHEQAKKFRLANGCWYTPDLTATIGGRETAWEVKGPHAWDDSLVKLKVAASTWPDVDWWLVWKDGGHWHRQKVLS